MKNLEYLLKDIRTLKAKYDEKRHEKRFNIFTALHKQDDEVRLHSRFIAYLLSGNSGHNMSRKFCELFIREVLELEKDKFDLINSEVLPNEHSKSEYKDIDILIINKTTKQAIIIENKINANDSNVEVTNKKNDGYDGQLERYYNTIMKGIDRNKIKIPDFKCNSVFVYYLTMYIEKQPSTESIGELKEGEWKVIYYGTEIKSWLEKCIKVVPIEKIVLKETIQQYLNLINQMTNNDIPIEERNLLKNEVASNWESTKYLIDNFKHVKWHTVDLFWTTLKKKLEDKYIEVSYYPNEFGNAITEVTHLERDIHHGIIFKFEEGKQLYISGYGKLTWGIVIPKKWSDFKREALENISFSNFSSDNTYRLTKTDIMKTVTDLILEEILEESTNNFENLKSDLL